jgi:hypothetical protein
MTNPRLSPTRVEQRASTPALVQPGYYGLGATFPLITLASGGWDQPDITAVPVPEPTSCKVLAMRWCGPRAEEDLAPDLLRMAAAASGPAPRTAAEAAAYTAALPPGLRLIALPPAYVLDMPWPLTSHRHRPSFPALERTWSHAPTSA